MEDVRVLALNLIGSECQGISMALVGLDGGCINIVACRLEKTTLWGWISHWNTCATLLM